MAVWLHSDRKQLVDFPPDTKMKKNVPDFDINYWWEPCSDFEVKHLDSSGKKDRLNNVDSKTDRSCSDLLKQVETTSERLLLLEKAISSARNGVVITDPRMEDNPIIYVNPAFLELTGYEIEEVIGKNCRFLQGSQRDQPNLEELRAAINEARPITTVLRNYRKDGSLFWNELTISPVHDGDGQLIAFIGIQNDVSARKLAEKRVSEFYSVVSHELRTPLSSIRASMGLIEDGSAGTLPKEASRLVQIAYRNTGRLLRLVSDILDFRKIESGKLDLKLEELSPSEVVGTAIRELAQVAKDKRIVLEKEIDTGEKFTGDHDRVVQIVDNLVANAIKFSPEGAPVKIKCERIKGTTVRFSVEDSGPGIPAADFDKLFERFQQLDSSDKRSSGGTGLGLAICKSLVELHGGEIGVESTVGSGSTFWFTLPAFDQRYPEG